MPRGRQKLQILSTSNNSLLVSSSCQNKSNSDDFCCVPFLRSFSISFNFSHACCLIHVCLRYPYGYQYLNLFLVHFHTVDKRFVFHHAWFDSLVGRSCCSNGLRGHVAFFGMWCWFVALDYLSWVAVWPHLNVSFNAELVFSMASEFGETSFFAYLPIGVVHAGYHFFWCTCLWYRFCLVLQCCWNCRCFAVVIFGLRHWS